MGERIGESIWNGFLGAIGFHAWGGLLGYWWVPIALVVAYILLSFLAKLKEVGGWPAVGAALAATIALVAGAFGFKKGAEWERSKHRPATAAKPAKGKPAPVEEHDPFKPKKVMFPGLRIEDIFRRKR